MIIMVTMMMTMTMKVGLDRDDVDDHNGYNDDDQNEGRTR